MRVDKTIQLKLFLWVRLKIESFEMWKSKLRQNTKHVANILTLTLQLRSLTWNWQDPKKSPFLELFALGINSLEFYHFAVSCQRCRAFQLVWKISIINNFSWNFFFKISLISPPCLSCRIANNWIIATFTQFSKHADTFKHICRTKFCDKNIKFKP